MQIVLHVQKDRKVKKAIEILLIIMKIVMVLVSNHIYKLLDIWPNILEVHKSKTLWNKWNQLINKMKTYWFKKTLNNFKTLT